MSDDYEEVGKKVTKGVELGIPPKLKYEVETLYMKRSPKGAQRFLWRPRFSEPKHKTYDASLMRLLEKKRRGAPDRLSA